MAIFGTLMIIAGTVSVLYALGMLHTAADGSGGAPDWFARAIRSNHKAGIPSRNVRYWNADGSGGSLESAVNNVEPPRKDPFADYMHGEMRDNRASPPSS